MDERHTIRPNRLIAELLVKFSCCLAGKQEGVFTNLRQMALLDLSINIISFIEPRVFDESANLTSLTTIYLSHNEMTELEPWPLIRAQHRRMYVDLSNNRITNFTNALRWSFDCNSTWVLTARLDLSANDIKHITDAVRGWNVKGKLSCEHVAYTIGVNASLAMGTFQQALPEGTGQWRI